MEITRKNGKVEYKFSWNKEKIKVKKESTDNINLEEIKRKNR